ncbi:hypothetical protein, partial [Sphingomonas sp. BK481]|uniref:hypothetical protein n=1 Tax=Sphingomonas sp. BK481 TaxID=2586981 RepID=UPI001C8537E1
RAGLIRGASSGARRHLSSTTLIPRDPFSTVSNGCDTTCRRLSTVPILKAVWQESPQLTPSGDNLARSHFKTR